MRYNRIYEKNNFIVPTDYTQTLCNYAESFDLSKLPPEVIEKAKLVLVHAIGAAYAAKDMPEAKKFIENGTQANGGPGGNVTLWGTGEKLSVEKACMVAGTLCDLLEWCDCTGTGHPSAAVAPVAWMSAEETQKGGKDVLRAMILAYDVAQRIAKATFPGERAKTRGFGMTSWQMFNAYMAAAGVYNFDARGYDLGLGTACENSTIPALYYKTTMSECGHYEFGFRNEDGLLCAKAVVKGLNNGRDAFDEDKCYNSAICDEPKHEQFKKGLGSSYEIMNSVLRKWPADMWAQIPAEMVSRLCREHNITADKISEIIIDSGVMDMMDAPDEGYQSIVHAQNSIPFVVASVISGAQPGSQWYSPEKLESPELLGLARKVRAGNSVQKRAVDLYENLAFKNELPEFTVIIRTVGGREFIEKSRCPGALTNREEVSAQFIKQCAPTLGKEKAEKALEILFNIENENNIAELAWIVGA